MKLLIGQFAYFGDITAHLIRNPCAKSTFSVYKKQGPNN